MVSRFLLLSFLFPCSLLFAEVTLKYATLAPENTVWAKTIKKCVDEIAAKTNGQVQVKVFYGGIAGDEPSVMRKLKTGTVDIASFTGQTLGTVVPESRLLELPYFFENTRQIDAVVAKIYPELSKKFMAQGIVLAGWSSGSTYSLLGGLRSSAQMISYEIAMGLSFVAVFLWAGTMSTSQIVNAQSGWWYAILLAPSFIIYAISMVGETNRAPFDLPEAEGELVAGFHTEYSGLRWAMFFLAEYINMINVAAIATTLFLGGWRMPQPIAQIWPGANEGWWPLLWFFGKIFVFLFVFIWLRGTLPRLRYDQFMRFGWKVLIPLSILWILVIATLKGIQNEYKTDLKATMLWIALILLVLAALAFVFDVRRGAREVEEDAPDFDAFAGGYPVPPLPGQELTVTRRAKATVAGTAVSSTVDVEADPSSEGEESTHE